MVCGACPPIKTLHSLHQIGKIHVAMIIYTTIAGMYYGIYIHTFFLYIYIVFSFFANISIWTTPDLQTTLGRLDRHLADHSTRPITALIAWSKLSCFALFPSVQTELCFILWWHGFPLLLGLFFNSTLAPSAIFPPMQLRPYSSVLVGVVHTPRTKAI